jgi:predicted O-linked N-acetylglucosamine transferase (SPINDLY family)
LHESGQSAEAETEVRRALQIQPSLVQAHSNLGNILQDSGHLIEAENCYRHALQLNPNIAEIHSNLGIVLQELGLLTDAENCHRSALQIDPNLASAHNNLGNTLQAQNRLSEAGASYRSALSLNPDNTMAHSNLLLLLNYDPLVTPEQSFAEALHYGQSVIRGVKHRYTSWSCDPQPAKLRIGFISGDFNNHPVGYFLESLISQLNLASFELIAYPTTHRSDELTARIKPYFYAWHPLLGLSDETAAKLIHDDDIHILIDLAGHTRHNRLPILAWKPAPVQVSWLGYFATTGMAEMDYLIADAWTLPESETSYFTESIWRLPETRLCFAPPNIDLTVAPLPALSNAHITFGCFNNLTKMNDDVVALWAQILTALPDSKLFLKTKQLNDPAQRQLTLDRYAQHGIPEQRLILEGQDDRATYLRAYDRVDIALDPFPYPGGTTTVEGLWMGVPALTLAGTSFLSRQGVGILMNAGLAEWVATNEDEYVTQAISHARDLQRLATFRNGLRQQALTSPIMNSQRFAQSFEVVFNEMWDRSNQTMPTAPA